MTVLPLLLIEKGVVEILLLSFLSKSAAFPTQSFCQETPQEDMSDSSSIMWPMNVLRNDTSQGQRINWENSTRDEWIKHIIATKSRPFLPIWYAKNKRPSWPRAHHPPHSGASWYVWNRVRMESGRWCQPTKSEVFFSFMSFAIWGTKIMQMECRTARYLKKTKEWTKKWHYCVVFSYLCTTKYTNTLFFYI